MLADRIRARREDMDLFIIVFNKYTPIIKKPRKCFTGAHILEPMVGVEPTTYSLRVNCSTTEPHWHTKEIYLFNLFLSSKSIFIILLVFAI